MTTLTRRRPSNAAALPRLSLGELLEPLFVALTLLGLASGLILERVGAGAGLTLALNIATYIFGGSFALKNIVASLHKGRVEVDLLMVLAALGAAYIGHWSEGAVLLFLFSLSNVLQHYALRRTERAIGALLELRPDTVTLRRDEQLVKVALDAVRAGDMLVLRPGERVAVDAQIVAGSGSFDESTITGESMPVSKGAGATIFAGTLNQSGAIDAQVLRPAAESTLSRIIGMVSEARERKARTQSRLDRFEQRYAVAIILGVALFIALVPLLSGATFAEVFYQGMVLLTVASPCALVISVPAALLSAIANAARHGVLFKGGGPLEDLARIKVVAFDKTGTVTYGRPDVADVLPQPGVSAEELLAVAARAELSSEHPLARAVRQAAERAGLTLAEPEDFEAVVGMGVRASWDGETTLIGSARLMERHGHAVPGALRDEAARLMQEGRGSTLLVRRGARWLGIVTVMDRERPELAQKIRALREAGVARIVMLTGDNRQVAEAIARRAGIDEVRAELLPEDKLRIVGELQAKYGPTAMVGDGINDAPALAAASLGIAMGAAGTDVALETADVVLMSDDLGTIAYALRLSKRARRIVWQNITFALAVVVVLVALTLTVGISLPLGVVGHEGSTILVVLNGLRLLATERDATPLR
jgi:Zn2+/Cd2+-exporting ATPase